MNKAVSITLAIACLGGGYSAASWYFGKQTEATLNAHYERMMEQVPYVKIIERDYQRGIFNSTETVTLEIFKELAALTAVDTNDGEPAKQLSYRLTVHNDIQHGPIPGFSTLAAASTLTEIMLAEGIEKDLVEQLSNKSLFNQQTFIRFDGSGHATFNSPMLDLTLPDFSDSTTDKTMNLSWEGMKGDMDFSADMAHFTLNALSPLMTFTSSRGEKINISDLHVSSDQQKAYEDNDTLYSGLQHVSIGKITVTSPNMEGMPFAVKQISYDVELAKDDIFFNLIERMGMETVQIGQETIGPFHFDISFNHLHGRALADISQSAMAFNTEMSKLGSDQPDFEESLIPAVKEQAQRLLDNHPEIRIDRISFATANGEANLSGRVTLSELNIEEAIENPFILLGSLNADGELTLEENMILELLRNPPGTKLMGLNDVASEEQMTQTQMMTEQFQQQVAMFTDMGYITREGGSLKTHAEFKAGQLLINGKPFPPTAESTLIEQESAFIESDPSFMEQAATSVETDPSPIEEAPAPVETETTPQ